MAKHHKQTSTRSTKKNKLNIVEIEHKAYPAAIDKRFFQLRFNMEDHKINAAFISYLPNIRYLTNYSGSAASMLITNDEVHFFTDDRYEEQVKTELYDLHNMKVHITRDV
jgi:Xaa-Pro aminopeptidase